MGGVPTGAKNRFDSCVAVLSVFCVPFSFLSVFFRVFYFLLWDRFRFLPMTVSRKVIVTGCLLDLLLSYGSFCVWAGGGGESHAGCTHW